MAWYKRLLCGYNVLGDFADFACRGTETRMVVKEGEPTIEIRCWCCTFWRGVVIGGLLGVCTGLLVAVFL